METTIYLNTGTGNSLWTARKLSALLENTEIVPVALTGKSRIHTGSKNIGFIFPVHIWGVPSPVIDLLNRMDIGKSQYCFAIGVNAGQVAATLIQLDKLLKDKGSRLSSGFSVCLPSNYIPWGGAIALEKQQEYFRDALDKTNRIAAVVKAQEEKMPEKGPAWQNVFLSAIYRMSYSRVAGMDKSFWADSKCTGCGVCKKICPARNIEFADEKPVWQHRCEQCFACLQWCPEEAIQYGKGTEKKKRYHHPEITLKDMLACVPGNNK